MIFVFGCPRSGTTFLAGALGSLNGYVDLGEVAPLKAKIPRLSSVAPASAAGDAKRILSRVQRWSCAGGLRAVEQTPETIFIASAIAHAYPGAVFLHLVRDGRDVVCSLEKRGWLASGRSGADDAGHTYGAETRFWVEPERAAEFAQVSDVRRAAWAWRRYVEAGRALGDRAVELRYEILTANPGQVAAQLGEALEHPVEELTEALSAAHDGSVGRHRLELSASQLMDVEIESGALLHTLGYLSSTGGRSVDHPARGNPPDPPEVGRTQDSGACRR